MGFEVKLRRMSNVNPKLLKMVHACRMSCALTFRYYNNSIILLAAELCEILAI